MVRKPGGRSVQSFSTALGSAAGLMASGAVKVAFVATPTHGWLFWSTDAVNTTIEQAARLGGLNNVNAFARSDVI
jgi:hypothetical protein